MTNFEYTMKVEGNVGFYKYFANKCPNARSSTIAAQTRASRTHLSDRQDKIPDCAIKAFIGMSRERQKKRGI